MDGLDKDQAAGLLDVGEPPCLSLYQPTHRRHPEREQDPIRFRHLVKALERPFFPELLSLRTVI